MKRFTVVLLSVFMLAGCCVYDTPLAYVTIDAECPESIDQNNLFWWYTLEAKGNVLIEGRWTDKGIKDKVIRIPAREYEYTICINASIHLNENTTVLHGTVKTYATAGEMTIYVKMSE